MQVYDNIINHQLRTVYIECPDSLLTAVKIFIQVGSQNDNGLKGITHLLEHLLFRKHNGQKSIFYQIEKYGGTINAQTAKDYLAVFFVVPNRFLFDVFTLVLDLVFRVELNESELEKEKVTVLKEILQHQNSNQALWDIFSLSYWKRHPLRYPVRGFEKDIAGMKIEDLINQYKMYFSPDNIVISAAGNQNKKRLTAFYQDYFEKLHCPVSPAKKPKLKPEIIMCENELVKRNFQLTHCFIGFPIPAYGSDWQQKLLAVSRLLTNGGYSILYQKLREENSLVYSVESIPLTYSTDGVFLIYTKSEPYNINTIINIIFNEIEKIINGKLKIQDIELLKSQYEGQLMRQYETVLSICNIYGQEMLFLNKTVPFADAVNHFYQITVQDLIDCADLFLKNHKIILIGEGDDHDPKANQQYPENEISYC